MLEPAQQFGSEQNLESSPCLDIEMGVSENVVYPEKPNGFADHYPYEKWLFHWEYTIFSDKPK